MRLGAGGGDFHVAAAARARTVVDEKERLLGESNKRIESALTRLHQHLDAGDASNAVEAKDILDAFEAEQRLLEKIPTWPWASETIRLLISALLFPIVLVAIQFMVQRMIAP